MNKERRLIIAGNWKMNKTVAEALDLVRGLRIELGSVKEVDLVVCPPFTALADGSCDIGMASRRIKPDEVAKLAQLGDMTSTGDEHVLGLDGIAVVVNASNPLSDEVLNTKFIDLASPQIGSARAQAGLDMLWQIETLGDVGTLLQALALAGDQGASTGSPRRRA